jgi:hypothetical protein
MRLQQWKANGWLQAHQTTPAQIADLFAIVDRDLEDSMRDLSPDWQFGIAYNAALKLCTILLCASGYQSDRTLDLAGSKPQAFLDLLASHSGQTKFDESKALFSDWKSADLLFQLTDGEISSIQQSDFFKETDIQPALLHSYLFFAIELKGKDYARGKLTGIARQINRVFPMPVMLLTQLLKGFDPESETSSTYYQAILQNLFFATLNQRMGKDGKGNPYRVFATDEGFQKNRATYDINNLYRYENLFAVPQDVAIALFADIPFLNGGLFECLDRTEDGTNKKLYLDGFSRRKEKRPHVPDRLFFDTGETADLSEVYGDKKRKAEKVTGLITILNYQHQCHATRHHPL